MKRQMFLMLCLFFIVIGCSNNNSAEKENNNVEPEKEAVIKKGKEIIAKNLDVPWSIQKDGDIFYLSERNGSIAKVEDSKVVHQKVELKSNLSKLDEGGLLGFILDPNFSKNQEAFAYYTYTSNSLIQNKIVKLELVDNVWREKKTLLSKIPGSNNHNGGRLKIGPDNKLYASVGDAYLENQVQNLKSLNGKILRLNLDGSIPQDNPYDNSYVYTYGHRNPQGFAWIDDKMYASEHGNSANDEINLIQAKQNYGWPIIEGKTKQEGMKTPLFTSGNDDTWAPSGIVSYENKIYVACLRKEAILVIDLESKEISTIIDDVGRIRDVYLEDEFLYFVSNNSDGRGREKENDDKLYKINLLAY